MSEEYDLNSSYSPKVQPDVPAANKGFTNEEPIAVQPFRRDDLQPSYAHQEDMPTNGSYGAFLNCLGGIMGTLGAIPCCFCCPNKYKTVNQGEVGLVSRFGRFYQSVDPGLVKVNPMSEKLKTIDMRVRVSDIPSQYCLTRDNVNIQISSVVYSHVVSPHKAAFAVNGLENALSELTLTTMRQVVGSRVLQEIIEKREEIAESIREIIEETTGGWGIRVESILIKDIELSSDLQESLSMAAKSKRAGESKIITARAEVESAKLMRKAADILESKAAMQIRYLEAMQQIAKTSNSKVLFMPSQNALESIAAGPAKGSSAPAGTITSAEETTDMFGDTNRLAETAAYLESTQ